MQTNEEIKERVLAQKKAMKILYKYFASLGYEQRKMGTSRDIANFCVVKDKKWQIKALVKDRQINVEKFYQYADFGLILEKSDLVNLQYHLTNCYINTFNIGGNHFFLQFDVNKINTTFEKRMLPARTFSKERKIEQKEVVMLYPRNARVFFFNGKTFEEIEYDELLGKIENF